MLEAHTYLLQLITVLTESCYYKKLIEFTASITGILLLIKLSQVIDVLNKQKGIFTKIIIVFPNNN